MLDAKFATCSFWTRSLSDLLFSRRFGPAFGLDRDLLTAMLGMLLQLLSEMTAPVSVLGRAQLLTLSDLATAGSMDSGRTAVGLFLGTVNMT